MREKTSRLTVVILSRLSLGSQFGVEAITRASHPYDLGSNPGLRTWAPRGFLLILRFSKFSIINSHLIIIGCGNNEIDNKYFV